MQNNFDLEVKKILKQAESEMFDLNHPYVGSEHMLLAILKISSLKSMLESYSLTYDRFRTELVSIVGISHKKSELALYTPLLKRIITDAIDDANELGVKVGPEHLLIGMLEEGEGIGIRILMNMDIDLEELYNTLSQKKVGPKTSLQTTLEVGKLLTVKSDEHVYKRDKEIASLIEILLRKNKNNPLLLGEAGVGKTAIVEETARRIEESLVPDALLDYKIIELDTGSLISGTRYRGEFEDRLNKIIKEVTTEGHIILFIDEIHTLVNCGGAEGAIDAANILKPYMARGTLKIIGATTLKEYETTIAKDKALDRRFQVIPVEEPNQEDTKYILESIKSTYEAHHNVIISPENIEDILSLSEKYIHNRFNPDKTIDILDSVCAHVQLSRPHKRKDLSELHEQKEKLLQNKKYKEALEVELKIKDMTCSNTKIVITHEDIEKVVLHKANIPMKDEWSQKIAALPDIIKTHVYGQDEAIDELCTAIEEKYNHATSKPLAIILKGPSGVGKTFLASEIANNLFGPNRFIRLDLSELSSEPAINRILGSPQGYVGYEDACLLGKLKNYPYSLIILDEIDKAASKVKNLFKEILEEGVIQNNKGETLHFENATFIMTSTTHSSNIGFAKTNNVQEYDAWCRSDAIITLKTLDISSAERFVKRESTHLDMSKEEIRSLIERANIESHGFRGLQKELNKYKISNLLTKV